MSAGTAVRRLAAGVRGGRLVAGAGRRRGRRPAWIAVLVALAVFAAGCSGGAAGAARTPAPTTLAGYYAQRLDWQPCDNGFECARLLVPFDYARPSWRRFSLPVIKLPAAEESRRIGALVVNPGGPGGSGVQYALGARSEFPSAVLARFDIVGFDPRGVAASEPALTCMSGPQLDTYLATDDMPADAAQLAEVVTQSKLYAARCAQNSAALLPYVGTQNAARDMDVLRAALGESRLTYLGKSYGTYLGTWYAQLFPHRVRALVLDGAVDPDTASLQDDITQAQGFQVALRSFAAWCLTTAGCPLRPAPRLRLRRLRLRRRRPVGGCRGGEAAGPDRSGQFRAAGQPAKRRAGGRRRDAAERGGLRAVQQVVLARPENRPDRRVRGERHGARGAGQPADRTQPQRDLREPGGRRYLLSCLDRPWPRSLAAWQAAASAASRAAPLFGAPLVWGNLPCAYWPVPSYPLPRVRAAGAPPILVVGTLRDPATPYRWAQALAGDLSSGVLLGWNGDGHTAYGEGSACVDTIVNDYLIDLSVPRSGMVCS